MTNRQTPGLIILDDLEGAPLSEYQRARMNEWATEVDARSYARSDRGNPPSEWPEIHLLTTDGRVITTPADSHRARGRTRDEGPGATIDDLLGDIDTILNEHRSER